ncbi:hypothetical protein [Limibacterium fermenti]|uniref:hypothetical protein n=1 Tax=Limibacterium fermenti TaxID=3229863 RepID=UPI003A77BA28
MKVDREIFFNLINEFQFIPLYQSEGYFKTKYSGSKKYDFHVNHLGNPSIGCWGYVIKIPFVGNLFYVESLVYRDTERTSLVNFLRELVSNGLYSIINLNDDNIYNPYVEQSFREAGFRRPLGQWGTALTVVVDLKDLKPYKSNWKKNIGKAAKIPGLSFQEINTPSDKLLDDIAQLFIENSEIKQLSYHYTLADLSAFMSDKKYRLYTVNINGEIIAARIIFVNKQYSYDVSTANGRKSREYRGVTHYLCSKIFEELQSEGVVFFDFSRIPTGRKGAEGVCLFKSGSNGVLVQYNGYWLYTKKNCYRYMMYFINKFIRKKYEY